MSVNHVLDAVNVMLFADSSITGIVGTNIAYARGPVSNKWPQVHYFEVTDTYGYQCDFNSHTVQISAWALDKWDALNLKIYLTNLFLRYRGKVSITGGTVDITWCEIIDSGALPESDPQLFGQYIRVKIRYRGTNLGGY